MPSVERLLRVRYYLRKKQVPASTPNATRVEEWSKDYYGVVYENGKRVRYRLEGVTTKTKAEERWKELLGEVLWEGGRAKDEKQSCAQKLVTAPHVPRLAHQPRSLAMHTNAQRQSSRTSRLPGTSQLFLFQ